MGEMIPEKPLAAKALPADAALRAAEFLEGIATGSGRVAIAAIPPDEKPYGVTLALPADRNRLLTVLQRAEGRTVNLYFTLNDPKLPEAQEGKAGKLKEADVEAIRGVAVDIDPDEAAEAEPGGLERERDRLKHIALEALAHETCPATAAIDSGNGVQLLWLFDKPLPNTPENREAVKRQAAGLAQHFGGDAVQSLDHLFRIPFTRNIPNRKKREKGRAECVSKLLAWDNGRRHSLEALAAIAPPAERASITMQTVAPIELDFPSVMDAAEGGPDALPAQLQMWAAALRERRGFSSAMEKQDRSARDFELAANCVALGMIDPTELAQVTFAFSPEKMLELEQKAPGLGERHASRTVAKALKTVKPDLKPEEVFQPAELSADLFDGGGRRSKFFPASLLQGRPVPPRKWLVPDLIPQNTVTLFGGDGGTGKSLLALQLAAGVAAGSGWLKKDVEQGGAIFISAEDDEDELHRRLADVVRAEGKTFADLQRLTLRSLAGEDALLAVETNLSLVKSTLYEELDARADKEKPSLIVIDTLADVYPSNENDRMRVRQFVGFLRNLALRHKCAVVLLAHPSLSGLNSGSGMSGSTAWNNSVRSRLYLSRITTKDGNERDPDKRILATKKANYGRVGDEITLRWRAGVFEVAARPAHDDEDAERASDGFTKVERIFLAILKKRNEQQRWVSHSPCPTYAPTQFEAEPEAEGIRKSAFADAMNSLFARGLIKVAAHGWGKKGRTHIAIAERDGGTE